MKKAEVRAAIRSAFNYWTEVTALTFREVDYVRGDIKISFHKNDGLCSNPFDGRGECPPWAVCSLSLGLILTHLVSLDHLQVTSWPTLSHQSRVLFILMKMSSGQRGHTMALICVLWRPMKSATPSAWVTPNSEALWWRRSTLVTVPTSGCIQMMWEASSGCMVSGFQHDGVKTEAEL